MQQQIPVEEVAGDVLVEAVQLVMALLVDLG
jgi:hypothetical protein